jgi:hypothetical protein
VSSRRVLLAPVLALVVAASACSGSESSSGSASGGGNAAAIQPQSAGASSSIPDPCTLVAADQLSSLVGAAPVANGPTEQFRGVTCHWEASGGAGSSLDLTVWPGKEFFSASPGATPVPGLGDEAEIDSSFVAHVIWRQGDITAQLVGGGLGEGGPDKVVALARSVAGRLPAS